MPVVPINNSYSNVPQFIDSLFDPDVRSLDTVESGIRSGAFSTQFAPTETPKILSVWTAAWCVYNGLPFDPGTFAHCQESDRVFLRILSQFFFANKLCLVVPQIALDGIANDLPTYLLSGYQQYPFVPGGKWDMNVVSQFLNLLVSGAHFVFIQDPIDLPPGVTVPSFYTLFTTSNDFKQYRRHDPGNSHYTSLTNVCGYYIPSIDSNQTPSPSCPFLLALLVGPTDSDVLCNPTTYSTFLQLEGWEATASRHNVDYNTIYQPTLWNISTFGACAYSEKRATTVFLAPQQWVAKTNPDTIMAPYAGAETRQAWLNTKVVKLA